MIISIIKTLVDGKIHIRGQGQTQVGARALWPNLLLLLFFFLTYFIYHFYSWSPFQNLRAPLQLATI